LEQNTGDGDDGNTGEEGTGDDNEHNIEDGQRMSLASVCEIRLYAESMAYAATLAIGNLH
jgi:hypothetical protein